MVVLELFFRLMNNLLTCFNVCLSDKLKKREEEKFNSGTTITKMTRERTEKKRRRKRRKNILSLLIEISHV